LATFAAESTERSFSIPAPRPLPVLGHRAAAIRYGIDAVGYMDYLFKRYGEVTALSNGGPLRIYSINPSCPGVACIYRPEMIQQITTQHDEFHKNNLLGPVYPTGGNISERVQKLKTPGAGLFSVNGDLHREHRRIVMPAFHKKRIEAYRDDMVSLTRQMLDSWQPGEQRNVAADMMLLTMQIATKTLFGGEVENGMDIGHAMHSVVKISPSVILFQYDVPGFPYKRFVDNIIYIEGELRKLIAEKRAKGVDGGDMLSLLLQAHYEDGQPLSEDEILGHTEIFFGAGHETSSNALSWTLFLLSQHPQIAADVLDEMQGVLHGDAPTSQQMGELPLLDRVIKESLRLLPPAPINLRIAVHETELGNYFIPAATEILISAYHTHRIADLYPDPYRFNPDRWLSFDPSPYQFHAFGAGPRMCIGAPFALMEIKIVLAMLLQKYRLELTTGAKIDRRVGVTMAPAKGLPMIVHKQDHQFEGGTVSVRGNIREMVALPA
jgi:cytochrome P450